MGSKRLSSSLVVFGNGRTHTGEVDGSGGSRLANYCLRAPTKWKPQWRPKWMNACLGQWVSGWRCRRVGWNCSFPPHPSLKTPVTLWFAGTFLEFTKESMHVTTKEYRWRISTFHIAPKNSSKTRSVPTKSSILYKSRSMSIMFSTNKGNGLQLIDPLSDVELMWIFLFILIFLLFNKDQPALCCAAEWVV